MRATRNSQILQLARPRGAQHLTETHETDGEVHDARLGAVPVKVVLGVQRASRLEHGECGREHEAVEQQHHHAAQGHFHLADFGDGLEGADWRHSGECACTVGALLTRLVLLLRGDCARLRLGYFLEGNEAEHGDQREHRGDVAGGRVAARRVSTLHQQRVSYLSKCTNPR